MQSDITLAVHSRGHSKKWPLSFTHIFINFNPLVHLFVHPMDFISMYRYNL